MNKVIKLTPQNMCKIITNLSNEVGKYSGCQFVVDGNDIHDGRKKFCFVILKLIATSRRGNFDISVVNIDAVSPVFKELNVTFPLKRI